MTERAGPRGGSRVFATTRSSSADLSIDQVVERLRRRDDVAALVLIGSTAAKLEDWSDIDLLVVLAEGPDFDLEFATIDGRPADIVFTNLDSIRRLADVNTEPEGRLADLNTWIGAGRIVFSRTVDTYRALEVAASRGRRRASHREQFFRWVELNVNLIKLERYLAAGTAEHLEALHLMLDQAFAVLPQDALVLAGIGWAGERAALDELRGNGGQVLQAIEAGRTELDAARRLAVYRSAAARVTESVGGLWAPGETAGGWVLRGDGEVVSSRWEELVEDR